MKFKYPFVIQEIDGKEFFTLFERLDKNKYRVTIYLGKNIVLGPKDVQSNMKNLLIVVKQKMEQLFFSSELSKYVDGVQNE